MQQAAAQFGLPSARSQNPAATRPCRRYDLFMSPRIRRVLKLVEELELDGKELRELRAELDVRGGCEIEPAACVDPSDRALAGTIKRRIDAAARGETQMVTMAQANVILRDRRKARRAAAR